MNIMLQTILILIVLLAIVRTADCSVGEAKYGIGKWTGEGSGNHRAVVSVAGPAPAVCVNIPWRRRDIEPEKKAVIVIDAASGKQVDNVVRININREYGDIAFQPVSGAGTYYVYYMPYTSEQGIAWKTNYIPPTDKSDSAWLDANQLNSEGIKNDSWKSLPEAQLVEIQANGEFHRFDPMEVTATAEETRQLIDTHKSDSYIVFPEDRRYPIRMRDELPLRWIKSGSSLQFSGEACRNEYYTFQLGVYAISKDIGDIKIKFDDLKSGGSKIILHCFNSDGVDFTGHKFLKAIAVKQGKVQPLWIGADITKDAEPGLYEGSITLKPEGMSESTVKLSIAVQDKVLEDRGDSELWRMSRLRWLDSRLGIEEEPTYPYTPVKVNGSAVSILKRDVKYTATGLPKSINSFGNEVLARPIEIKTTISGKAVQWKSKGLKELKSTHASVFFESTGDMGPLSVTCRSKAEFDGYTNYRVVLKASKAINLDNVTLEIPVRRDIATFFTGFGCNGGYRPKSWQWDWSQRGISSCWLGEVNAGLYLTLKNGPDMWDIEGTKSPDAANSWHSGKCLLEEDGDAVIIKCSTGPAHLKAGEQLPLRFGMLITPVKPINMDHFNQRYYQFYNNIVQPQDAKALNATVINIHQGNELNPYINYPFRTVDKMRDYIDRAHALGMKAKIYNTVRELSNFCAEIWALRSLDHEILQAGGGKMGESWLVEHLVDDYQSAWHQPYANGEIDAAMATTGTSRWCNYYIEGVSWLARELGLDGIYIDGLNYDREGMKRFRRALDTGKSGNLLDLHDGDNFKCGDARRSSFLTAAEFTPYLNSLWYGEIFNYEEEPDYWLVELSGIPFGLMGDMLQMPINPWRGMTFGMAGRYWSGADPQYLWKTWIDLKLSDCKMIGWWDTKCPVKTGYKAVLATVYKNKGYAVIALGSWAKPAPGAWEHWPNMIKLQVDWKALGLDPKKVKLYAPEIKDFQPERKFELTEEIPVDFGKGWLLVVK